MQIGTIVEFNDRMNYTLGIICEITKDRETPYRVSWISHPGVYTNCSFRYLKILFPASKLTKLIFL